MNELEISSLIRFISAHNHSLTAPGALQVRCMPGVLPVSRCGAGNRVHKFIQQKTEVSEPCDVTVGGSCHVAVCCLSITEFNGVVSGVKSNGPKTEPSGNLNST